MRTLHPILWLFCVAFLLVFNLHCCPEDEAPESCDAPTDLFIGSHDHTSNSIELTWPEVINAEEYLLAYTNSVGDSLNILTEQTSQSLSLASSASSHQFTIHAHCPDGIFAIGPTVGLENTNNSNCDPPTDVEATPQDDGTVELSWTNSPGITTVNVVVTDDVGGLFETSVTGSTVTVEAPSPGESYTVSLSSECGEPNGGTSSAYAIYIIPIESEVEGCNNSSMLAGATRIFVRNPAAGNRSWYYGIRDFCSNACRPHGGCQ